jgi:hypothetical protein
LSEQQGRIAELILKLAGPGETRGEEPAAEEMGVEEE